MAKFKIGDRVRHPDKGMGTVLEISSNPFVEYERYIRGHDADGLGKKGHCWAQHEDLLKLVEEARPTPAPKFKVGDKVVGNHPSRYGTTKLGWKGTVHKVYGNKIDVGMYTGLEDKYFDLENEVTTSYQPIEPKVGDKYRVLKKMFPAHGIEVGSVIEIGGIKENGTVRTSNGFHLRNTFRNQEYLTTEYLELVEEARPTITDRAMDDIPFGQCPLYYTASAASVGTYSSLQPIKKTIIQKTMNAFKNAMLGSDTKTLIKAGYMYEDSLTLTTRGKEALEFILFEDNKVALVKAAEAEIKETEKRNK